MGRRLAGRRRKGNRPLERTRQNSGGSCHENRAAFHSETETITAEPTQGYGGISGSLRDFLNALETGATPMGECHDNIKSLAMVFAAIESARTGQKVAIASV